MDISLILVLGLLVYIYLGYPALLWGMARWSSALKSLNKEAALPSVSLIIAARNEAPALMAKIENFRSWDFPLEKLQIILVSDGSTDQTAEVFEAAMQRWKAEGPTPEWTVVKLPTQQGKSLAQNEGVRRGRHEILVFSDAGALFEPQTLTHLVTPFQHKEVGCVSGKTVYRNTEVAGAAHSEGAYFRYESWIRSMESATRVLTMGSGCILALRQELFQPLRATEGEDWALCLRTVEAGYRVLQVNSAIAYEDVATSSRGLFRTKVRIISKDALTLWQRRHLLNPFSYGRLAIALLSHKGLRWLTFLWMAVALILNGILAWRSPAWAVLFFSQILFYTLALLGAVAEQRPRRASSLITIPYNFCVVQLAAAFGIWKAFTGRSEAVWQPIRTES